MAESRLPHARTERLPTPTAAVAADFLPPYAEGRAFWQLRIRLVTTALRQAFAATRFRVSLILVLSVLLWLGLFWLFADGFWLIKTGIRHPDIHDQTVRAVFGAFFAALLVMLLFSSGVILYGSLFRSPEVAMLLTTPAREARVFLHKFQEAILWSSWGFVLLGSPMLLAYGIVAGAPWYYFATLPAFLIAFVYIPAALGAMACLLVMYHLPGRRMHVLVAVVVVLAAGTCSIAWSLAAGPRSDLLTPDWFREMLGRLQFSEGRLLPSWWLSSGLLEAARNEWSECVMFLVLLIANALFLRQLALWTASRTYRPAFSSLHGRPQARKRARAAAVDWLLYAAAGFLPREVRLMMVKDFRLFRRDPVQWSQFLIFLGLLGLYFVNIRTFHYDSQYIGWVNMVSFLNLSVVGLLMSTFTTRFVFPMISLEGQRFWVLGLLPVRRETILWSKFAFAVGGSLIPCSALIFLSDCMLAVAPLILASHQLTCAVLCVGLAGIAVGLGARLPSLREQSPSRVAAGFGGTLNLVVSTLYIVVVVLLTALPCHFYVMALNPLAETAFARESTFSLWIRFWFVAGAIGSVVLGVLATFIPLRMGIRAFRRMEF